MVVSRTPDVKEVMLALEGVNDPEMPINIVDLGMVGRVHLEPENADTPDPGTVAEVELLPTFVGCPALPMIADEVQKKLSSLTGVSRVDVRFVFDPPWSVDRISERGRVSLAGFGVSVPLPIHQSHTEQDRPSTGDSAVPCPFCGSAQTQLESKFGPTRCRMIYYCGDCHNSFEHLKRL